MHTSCCDNSGKTGCCLEGKEEIGEPRILTDDVRWRIVQRENQLHMLMINGFGQDNVERLLAEQGR